MQHRPSMIFLEQSYNYGIIMWFKDNSTMVKANRYWFLFFPSGYYLKTSKRNILTAHLLKVTQYAPKFYDFFFLEHYF